MNNSNNMQTLKGFRDILPQEKRARDFVANSMTKSFAEYGFAPLETPTLEYAELLLGKYGKEADKLVYSFADRAGRQIGLRYDQTVPTARLLAQSYQQELPKFFRRYQIQNVFRADKPQRGRYREFTQCDCDIFGTISPIADAEILAVFYAAFRDLGFESFIIEINDRQTLMNILKPFANEKVDVFSIIQSVDKLDKLSPAEVVTELTAKGLDAADAEAVLSELNNAVMSDQLSEIVDICNQLGVPKSALVFNPKLARGLDYYTGLIFEGRIPEYTVGSVGGGGRYDQLIESLAGVSIPAVGFGIGFDRAVDAATQLDLISPKSLLGTQVLVGIFSQELISNALQLAAKLRQTNIRTEIYPTADKLAKQFKLADQKQIPFVAIVGEEEATNNQVTLKNMNTGQQETLDLTAAIKLIQDQS
jgi:histidyl-tRNA synthetase